MHPQKYVGYVSPEFGICGDIYAFKKWPYVNVTETPKAAARPHMEKKENVTENRDSSENREQMFRQQRTDGFQKDL